MYYFYSHKTAVLPARLLHLLFCLCLLSVKMKGQDTCHQVPLRPIFILNNPSLLAAAPCTSGFAGIPFWYPASTEMLTGFLQPCTNYVIPDATYISGAAQTPQVAIFPVVPQPVPDGAGVIAVSDYGYATGSIYTNPDYKSFATTCLSQTLRYDSLYRLDFYVGFGLAGTQAVQLSNSLLGPEYSTTTETFGLFAMSDCSAVGIPIPFYSCINRAGWIPIGEVTVKGGPGTWNKASILFTAPADINVPISPSRPSSAPTTEYPTTSTGIPFSSTAFSSMAPTPHHPSLTSSPATPVLRPSSSKCSPLPTTQHPPSNGTATTPFLPASRIA
jgi:hypothetical protein